MMTEAEIQAALERQGIRKGTSEHGNCIGNACTRCDAKGSIEGDISDLCHALQEANRQNGVMRVALDNIASNRYTDNPVDMKQLHKIAREALATCKETK